MASKEPPDLQDGLPCQNKKKKRRKRRRNVQESTPAVPFEPLPQTQPEQCSPASEAKATSGELCKLDAEHFNSSDFPEAKDVSFTEDWFLPEEDASFDDRKIPATTKEAQGKRSCALTELFRASSEGRTQTVRNMIVKDPGIVNSTDHGGRSALHFACHKGHDELAAVLIKHGAEVNLQDKEGKTPLWAAVSSGHKDVVRLLLKKGADVNARDNMGQTSLWKAIVNGRAEILTLLLQNDADINIQDTTGSTVLWDASLTAETKVLHVLLQNGADVNLQNNLGETVLWNVCLRGQKEVLSMLLDYGADVNIQDKMARTPLFAASTRGHEEIASLLLQHGADVNIQDAAGETALWESCASGYYRLSYLLLRHSADLNIQDNNGQTVLWTACLWGQTKMVYLLLQHGADINISNQKRETVLWKAILSNNIQIVSAVLQHGADINAQNINGETPLWFACRLGRGEIVSVLLQHGADCNRTNRNFESPLQMAVKREDISIIDNLLRYGADCNSTSTTTGRAVLHEACVQGNANAVKALLDKGAKLNVRDKGGLTPLALAAQAGHRPVVDLLGAGGAAIGHQGDRHFAKVRPPCPSTAASKESVRGSSSERVSRKHKAYDQKSKVRVHTLPKRGADQTTSRITGEVTRQPQEAAAEETHNPCAGSSPAVHDESNDHDEDDNEGCWRCSANSSSSLDLSDDDRSPQDFDNTIRNMFPIMDTAGRSPLLSPYWQGRQELTVAGGQLRKPGSEVVLTVPPGAVRPGTSVTVYVAVCVDLDLMYARMKLPYSNDTIVVSPVAEYWAGDTYKFQRPVFIALPHFLPHDVDIEDVRVFRVSAQEDSSCVSLSELPLGGRRSEMNAGSLDTNGFQHWFSYDRETKELVVHTNHFSGYVCTHSSRNKGYNKTPHMFLRGKGTLKYHNDRQHVHVDAYIWDERIKVPEFTKDPDIKGLTESVPVDLCEVLPDSKLLVQLLKGDGLRELRHSLTDTGSTIYPQQEELDLCEWIGCKRCVKKRKFSYKHVQWQLHFPPHHRDVRSLVLFIQAVLKASHKKRL